MEAPRFSVGRPYSETVMLQLRHPLLQGVCLLDYLDSLRPIVLYWWYEHPQDESAMRESTQARAAFEDYYNLGHKRTLMSLVEGYRNRTEADPSPPTRRKATIKGWSAKHRWQARVALRDAEIAKIQFDAIRARAQEAGYAHWPKRVQDLMELGELLLDEIKTEEKRWLPDVKQIGSGKQTERVDIVRFNSALIEQFRKTLDDIAAEMGERQRSLALTGKDGGPIELLDHGAAARDELLSRLLSPAALGGKKGENKPTD